MRIEEAAVTEVVEEEKGEAEEEAEKNHKISSRNDVWARDLWQ